MHDAPPLGASRPSLPCRQPAPEARAPLSGNWATTDQFDWATGTYADGYGPKRDQSVTHERTIIFVKPDYFVVFDRLLGQGEHTVSNLFHLAAADAALDQSTLAVRSTDADAANLALIPVDRDGLTVRIVKGQEDPVQGWAPMYEHRAVPTPIYEKRGPCPQTFVTLLVPYGPGAAPTVTAELLDTGGPRDQALAFRVKRGDATDTILYSFTGPRRMTAAGITAAARLALVRSRPGAQPSVATMDGKLLSAGN